MMGTMQYVWEPPRAASESVPSCPHTPALPVHEVSSEPPCWLHACPFAYPTHRSPTSPPLKPPAALHLTTSGTSPELPLTTTAQKHSFKGEFAQPNILASSATSVRERQYLQPEHSPRNYCVYGHHSLAHHQLSHSFHTAQTTTYDMLINVACRLPGVVSGHLLKVVRKCSSTDHTINPDYCTHPLNEHQQRQWCMNSVHKDGTRAALHAPRAASTPT
jgi:hypothetical protein